MVSVLRKLLPPIEIWKSTWLIILSEKQLTKRLERWNFRKNKSRKQTGIVSRDILEARHGTPFESTDTHTTNINKWGIYESNAGMGVELQHIEAGFQQTQILGSFHTLDVLKEG